MANTSLRHRDPICGRLVSEQPCCATLEYKRRRYYFCSERCQKTFAARAEKMRLLELARAGALLTPGKVRWALG